MKKLLLILLSIVLLSSFCSAWWFTPTPPPPIRNSFELTEEVGAYASIMEETYTNMTVADQWYPVEGIFMTTPSKSFYVNTSIPALIYNGTETIYVEIQQHLSLSGNVNGQIVHIGVAVNGVVNNTHRMGTFLKTKDEPFTLSQNEVFEVSQGDIIQLMMSSETVPMEALVYHYTTSISRFFSAGVLSTPTYINGTPSTCHWQEDGSYLDYNGSISVDGIKNDGNYITILRSADRYIDLFAPNSYFTQLGFWEADNKVYGFKFQYDSSGNEFQLQRHNNAASGTNVITWSRSSGNMEIENEVQINDLVTGTNAGSPLCFDANDKLCKCGQCA